MWDCVEYYNDNTTAECYQHQYQYIYHDADHQYFVYFDYNHSSYCNIDHCHQ